MRHRIWLWVLAAFVVIIALLAIFWDWDWFIPMVDARASAALGRQVTIRHLQVGLGGTTTVIADDVTLANPQGFPADAKPLATIDRLLIKVNIGSYIAHGRINLPLIEVDHPVATVRQLPDGKDNYSLSLPQSKGESKPPELGELVIKNGSASVVMPEYKTDFDLTVATRNAPADSKLFKDGEIYVTAKGKYAGAPVTGKLTGGALLALRNTTAPYPVDLQLENGTTKASLVGTIKNPMQFAGANLKLTFAGQNMANLYALTGVPIPETPPFSLTGDLDYSGGAFRFEHFAGKVGTSDLEGTIVEAPGSPRRTITGDLVSRQVNLVDLAGFLGGTPGSTHSPGADAATRAKIEKAKAKPTLLPNTPIDLPKIKIADIDLRYRGEHIINKNVPLDDLVVHLIIKDGRISADPLDFAVGSGKIESNFEFTPAGKDSLHAKANIEFKQLPLSRLMAATHAFAGSGTVGGSAYVVGTGDSLAGILGHGDGHAYLFLQHGGNLSALLVDLAGLQVGDAVLSALGVPSKTHVECLIGDFALTQGQLETKAFLLATKAANILGAGGVDLATEKLDLKLRTEATHFSVGSLSTPIDIGGTLKDPSILPAAGPLAARAGPAVALGLIFPPLALIPTIRLGLGDRNACADTLQSIHEGHPHNPK
jgi:uncharacterized protein involved in outer membrane biogenesis